jgi:hypothetical protein
LRLARALLHPAGDSGPSSAAEESVPDMQVTLRSGANLLQFRELTVSPVVGMLHVNIDLINRPTRLPLLSDCLVSSSMPLNNPAEQLHYIYNVKVVDP